MIQTVHIRFWSALVVCSFVAASTTRAAIDVKLRERVAPHGAVVRLGDVAEIRTANRQDARQLAAMPLMPAPAAGTERFLRTREIQDMLSAQGVDIGLLHFTGAEQVDLTASQATKAPAKVVQASGQMPIAQPVAPRNQHAAILAGIDKDEKPQATPLDDARANDLRTQIAGIITNHLNAKTGKKQDWKVECDLSDRELLKLNTAQSTPACSGGSEPWTGRQRFLILFTDAAGQQQQLAVFAEISPPPVPAVIAIRPIGRGETIKAADVELRMVVANSRASGQRIAAESIEKLIGMEARQGIQAGDIVFTDLVLPPIVVKRGDIITIVSQSGGIRVRTTGKALQDAARGELVQVEAIGSREKYDARVTGPREAAVYSMSRPATPQPATRVETARRQGLRREVESIQ